MSSQITMDQPNEMMNDSVEMKEENAQNQKEDDGTSTYDKEFRTLNNIIYLKFFICASFAVTFLVLNLVYFTDNQPAGLPVMHSLYTTNFGETPDSVHPTLYGYTTLLKHRTGQTFTPIPSLPVSMADDTTVNLKSYYHCLNGIDYATTIGGATPAEITVNTERAKNICMVERISGVAFYENDENSITFSSAWNPVFMVWVVFWLYSSWYLLFLKPWKIFRPYKPFLLYFWHAVGVVFLLVFMFSKNRGYFIPKNNIFFAFTIYGFTLLQQAYYTTQVYVIKNKNIPTLDMFARVINKKQAGRTIITEGKKAQKLNGLVLMAEWLLFPVLAISIIAMCSTNGVQEWVFQSIYVRMQLVVITWNLLQQLNVINDREPNKFWHPRLLLVVSGILLLIMEVVSQNYQLNTAVTHPDLYPVFYTNLAFYFFTATFLLLFVGYLTTFAPEAGPLATYPNVIVLFIYKFICVIIILSHVYSTFGKYSCFDTDVRPGYCGSATSTENLNQDLYTKPLLLTNASSMANAYAAIQSTLTFSA